MRHAVLPTQTTPIAAAISAALLICTPSNAHAQALEDVVVSASRTEQRSFDAPGSIQSVDRESIQSRGPQINISEALAEIPGIHVANDFADHLETLLCREHGLLVRVVQNCDHHFIEQGKTADDDV